MRGANGSPPIRQVSRSAWASVCPGGEGSTHAIDPLDPDIVYSSGFYGTLSRNDLSRPHGNPQRAKDLLPRRFPDAPRPRGE